MDQATDTKDLEKGVDTGTDTKDLEKGVDTGTDTKDLDKGKGVDTGTDTKDLEWRVDTGTDTTDLVGVKDQGTNTRAPPRPPPGPPPGGWPVKDKGRGTKSLDKGVNDKGKGTKDRVKDQATDTDDLFKAPGSPVLVPARWGLKPLVTTPMRCRAIPPPRSGRRPGVEEGCPNTQGLGQSKTLAC